MPTIDLPETPGLVQSHEAIASVQGRVRIKDAIPRWRACLRRLKPLRVIAHKSLRGPYSQSEFIDATSTIRDEAAECGSIPDKTRAFWRMEKLGFSYCRNGQGLLNDDAIPISVQPISHVGLGIAAAESASFQPTRIAELIEPRAHPDYRLFPYESVGCIWAVYANKWFQYLFRMVSRTKIPPTTLPDMATFLAAFSPEIRSLISHGYGRSLYFRDYNVQRAIRSAVKLHELDKRAVVQGIAFAYAMINSADIHRVLDVGRDLDDPELAGGFQDGLTYALTFWEWAFPGFLELLTPSSPRQQEFIRIASEQVVECRANGALSVFGVAAS